MRAHRASQSALALLQYTALVIVAISCLNCSFVFVRPPKGHYEDPRDVQCTESSAAPVWDVIFFAGSVVGLLLAVDSPNDPADDPNGVDPALALGANVLSLVLHGTSMMYGFKNTKECRAIRQRFESARRDQVLGRPQLGPKPTHSGCTKDIECKGERICENGRCTLPVSRVPKPDPTCQKDVDCDDDLICVERRCRNPNKDPDTTPFQPFSWGISLTSVKNAEGAKVISIAPRSPAALAGLRDGDVITQVFGLPVGGPEDLVRVLKSEANSIQLKVRRETKTIEIVLRRP